MRLYVTVNSLINGHTNQRTPLIIRLIHFPRQIASQTLIVESLKSGQAIGGLSFQQTHIQTRNENFAIFFSLISGQGTRRLQVFPSHIQHLCLIYFLSLCKKVSNLEALRIYVKIWIYCVAYVQLFLMYFRDGTLSSCTEISLTSFKDIELCFQKKVIFSSFCILFSYVLIQVLRIPILVLNFRIQHPRNLEPLKYPSLAHKRSKI